MLSAAAASLHSSPTSGFSWRSCALPPADSRPSAAASRCTPTCPDAASLCPMLALAAPTASGDARPLGRPHSAAASEPASVGSPSAVPVPCASSRATPAAATPAAASAAPSSVRCAEPLGAVRLALRPSCRTAEPSKFKPSVLFPPAASTVQPTPSLRT